MTRDESLTRLHTEEGALDQRRVERILQLEAENEALRTALTALVNANRVYGFPTDEIHEAVRAAEALLSEDTQQP